MTAEVTYADVHGTQRTLTRLTVAQAGTTTLVKVIGLYHCDSEWAPVEPPFVQTRLPDGPEPAQSYQEEREPLTDTQTQRRILTEQELAAAEAQARAEG